MIYGKSFQLTLWLYGHNIVTKLQQNLVALTNHISATTYEHRHLLKCSGTSIITEQQEVQQTLERS